MSTGRSRLSRPPFLSLSGGGGDRTPTSQRSLRLVPAPPPSAPIPDESDTFSTVPRGRASDPVSPDATIVDEGLANELQAAIAKTELAMPAVVIPPAPTTELMLDRPQQSQQMSELQAQQAALDALPSLAPESRTSTTDLTEVMFDADAAMFPIRRQPRAERAIVEDGDRPSNGPALVAHVIPPRRNYALVAALLAWTVAVAFGVYVIAMHRGGNAPLPAAPPAATANLPK